MKKKSCISLSAKKLDQIINSPTTSSDKLLKIKNKKALQKIKTLGSFFDSINSPKEVAFNKTKKYKELKSKVNLKNLMIKAQEKEKEDRLIELFSHSSKKSDEYIDPNMFLNSNIRKILSIHKRNFGNNEQPKPFPEIKPQIKYLVQTEDVKKRLDKILYNNTYRNSMIRKKNWSFKEISPKNFTNQYYTPRAHNLSLEKEDEKPLKKADNFDFRLEKNFKSNNKKS